MKNKFEYRRISESHKKILGFVLFILMICSSMNLRKSSAFQYPGTSYWLVESNKDLMITEDFQLKGQIDVEGNLTIKNCKITIKDNIYLVNVKNQGNLTIENVVVQGIDSNSGTDYGGMKIVHQGNFVYLKNVSFSNMKTRALLTEKKFFVENCSFDTLSQNAIKVTDNLGILQDCSILNSSFIGIQNKYSVVYEEQDYNGFINHTFENNKVINSGGFKLDWLQDSRINGNVFVDCDLNALDIYYSERINVTENQINDTSFCINVRYARDKFNCFNNDLNNVKSVGVRLDEPEIVKIINNTIDLAQSNAIGIETLRYYDYDYFSNFFFIDKVNITYSDSKITESIFPFKLGTGYGNSHNITITNETWINDVPVKSFKGLENTSVDLSGMNDLPMVIITNCSNTTFTTINVQNGHGLYFGDSTNCTLQDSLFNNNSYTGVDCSLLKNCSFINITANDNGYCGMEINREGIGNMQCYGYEIKNSSFLHNQNDGLKITGISNGSVVNITSANNLRGIYMRGVKNTSIINSTLLNNTIHGIYLSSSFGGYENINITHCDFIKNGFINLELDDNYWYEPSNISYCEFIKSPEEGSYNINYEFSGNNPSSFLHNHYSDHIAIDGDDADNYADDPYYIFEDIIFDPEPLFIDDDGDRLDNLAEIQFGTSPSDKDFDDDGLNDLQELFPSIAFENESLYIFKFSATNPFIVDTDGDGLNDSHELFISHTNPNVIDTDFDGFNDTYEVTMNTSPINSSDWPGVEFQDTTLYDDDKGGIDLDKPNRSVMAIPSFPIEWMFLFSAITFILFMKKIHGKIKKNLNTGNTIKYLKLGGDKA